MSEENSSQSWNEEMDRPEHERMFDNFIKYTKYSSVAIILTLLFLLVFVYQ
jgi:hypothetical protein